MNPDIDLELLTCFIDETLDSLELWERCCFDLETRGASTDILNALFRAAHNIKGASRAVGLESFGAFVHSIEDVIQSVQKSVIKCDSTVISFLLKAQEVLADWAEKLKEDQGYSPDTNELQATALKLLNKKIVLEAVESIKPTVDSNVISSTEELDKLIAEMQGQLSSPVVSAEKPAENVQQMMRAEAKPKPPLNVETADKPAAKSDETIRVAASKLDELIQSIGELSIHQAIVAEAQKNGTMNSKICANALALSQKISKELHNKALSLRMQPVQGLFQRLERVIRDVARSQEKQIKVVQIGTEVELDKTVIERITDPLIHVVRNAVDHGIETTEGRSQSGKEQISILTLTAQQDATDVCITVSDDGRGIDPEKVRKKAVEKGLISVDAQLSKEELINLIFLPGFSTAEKVTDISGRGVGMDVVMKAVQALQGNIQVSSELGKGSAFTLRLPMSLSIVDALVVKIDEIKYAVAMHELTEIIDLSDMHIEASGNDGQMLDLRGQIIPVAKLGRFLANQRGTKNSSLFVNGRPALLIKETRGTVAFEIDRIMGQQQIVVRPLSEKLSGLGEFSGCTILGDGEPGMILSLNNLARSYFNSTAQGARV